MYEQQIKSVNLLFLRDALDSRAINMHLFILLLLFSKGSLEDYFLHGRHISWRLFQTLEDV